MKTITVEEAVQKVNNGKNLKVYVLDKQQSRQVNVRDAMVLNRGGLVIPEENLFYEDEKIAYDADIDELQIGAEITGMSWKDKAKRASENNLPKSELVVDLTTSQPEIDSWIQLNKSKLEELLRPIVVNLFNAEKSFED